MLLALFGTLALAAPSVNATLVPGVTASGVASAKVPVQVMTFAFKSATWSVACKGAAPLTCTVTSPGQPAGEVVSATATTLVLRLGGQEIELKAPGSPLSLQDVIISS